MTAEGRALYKKRKQTVEQVFGEIKGARGFCQFLRGGVDGAAERQLRVEDELRAAPAHGAIGQDRPVLEVPLVELINHEEADVLAVELARGSGDALETSRPSSWADLPA